MNTNIPSRPTAGNDRGPRVLVVEDDPHSRWALCALFRRLGYDCRAAADGSEALRTVAEFAPRVILMDLMMPGIDGLEATRRLKANAATRPIPILALTGNVTPSGESAARQAGCDDFVPKPIVFHDLIARVRNRLGQPPDANRAAGQADDRGPRGWHRHGRRDEHI